MSHEVESMFAVRKPAWHGVGTWLEGAPSLEEGLSAAGLDWRVIEQPVCVGQRWTTEWKGLVRETDDKLLSIVRSDWRPLQNRTAFAWFAPLVADGDCALEAAGSLRGGRTVWILAHITGAAHEVAPGDVVRPYVLLTNSHESGQAVRVGFTATRVVCQNTLRLALGRDAQYLVRVFHRATMEQALVEARSAMDLARQSFRLSVEDWRRWRATGLSATDFRRFVCEVFEAPEDRVPRCYEELERLWAQGAGAAHETVWGAVNAIAEWVTHVRGRRPDSRLAASWFGQGSRLLERAQMQARELVR